MIAKNLCMVNALGETKASISYRRLRAPQSHGKSLEIPPLPECQLDSGILDRLTLARSEYVDLTDAAKTGRREILKLAERFTSGYRGTKLADRSHDRIILSGHQPALFHPGVWYKNFALSQLGKELEATPINLIVDNDICGVAAIKTPDVRKAEARIRMLPLDDPGDNIPFEEREIQNLEVFKSFGERASDQIRPFVPDPIVNQLWKYLRPGDNQNRLGQTVATARHAYEETLGLQTLEVPLGQVAQTFAFAQFAKEVFFRIEAFQDSYNAKLVDYRRLHRIRSRSHPVPQLSRQEGWFETPFWAWDRNQPIRRGLYVRRSKRGIELTDLNQLHREIGESSFAEQFRELTQTGFVIRPRALMTTMFSRLLLSDLFLHGIGGAKYDQLTDAIANEFFGIELPPFVTLTATMKLPTGSPDFSPDDLTELRTRLRDLKYHPESHLVDSTPEATALARLKRDWIEKAEGQTDLKERHLAIESCNDQLQRFVAPLKAELEQRLLELSGEMRNIQILGSREFSFSLFPESLAQELLNMAKSSA